MQSAPAAALAQELDWLAAVLEARLRLYFGHEAPELTPETLPAPALPTGIPDAYAELIQEAQLDWAARLLLILALAPHLRPQALDPFFARNATYDRPFTEFGGRRASYHSGFLPTGQTALFLLAGDDLARRLTFSSQFWAEPSAAVARLVTLAAPVAGEPALSGLLSVPAHLLNRLITGTTPAQLFGADFPAHRLTTPLRWADLVLSTDVLQQVSELQTWLQHQAHFLHDPHLSRQLQPGYRALFYGLPGTGKTLTAALLGQAAGREVYRISLALLSALDATEAVQALAQLFEEAERRQWVLLVDDAEVLLNQPRKTADADHLAPLTAAYLLQRIEEFGSTIVLAANLDVPLAETFRPYLQAAIHFPLPESAERERLWRQAFAAVDVSPEVDFVALATNYPLTGGAISNVLRRCVLRSLQQQSPISLADIRQSVQRELAKDGHP